MNNQRDYYRHILLFYFLKSKKLSDVYGENGLIERRCQCWFAHFRSGNFNVQDALHTGCSTTTDDDKIKALIETNQSMTTR